jgi:tetratricopeptide (TPR) repeat protein
MDPRLHGSLGESLLPDLIREIARRGASGALRLSRENAARSIYFDSGTPVSLTSELADEQLESRLLKDGRTTAGLIQAARRALPKSPLSRALVDKGVLSEESLSLTTGELVKQIVLSIFEWEEGEYEFDEGAQPAEAAALHCTPADLIRGARHAAGIERLAKAIAPPDLLIAPADTNNYFLASLPALDSVESYVLSRIELPVCVSEVADLVGVPEEDTHRAVCVLVALGLLARVGYAAPEAAGRSAASPDPLLAAVSRKLQLFESADYYEVLGVDMFATAASVTRAFGELQRMFDSYRALSPDNEDLHGKLDTLFSKVTEAYQTLSDPTKRWAYDKTKASTNKQASKRPPGSGSWDSSQKLSHPLAPTGEVFDFNSTRGDPQDRTQGPGFRTSATPIERLPQPTTAELHQPKRAPIAGLSSSPIETPAAPLGVTLTARERRPQPDQPQWVTASQTALRNYNQGRTRYEQKDVNAAHHLFREACRLDPAQPHYHFYLAMTQIILSQARREHAHHEGCHVTCSLGGALVSNPRMRYEAEQHLLKAAELDPANPQIPLRLGLLFKDAGLTKKAEHYFHETLLRDSKNKTALFELESLQEDDKQTTPDLNDQETDG